MQLELGPFRPCSDTGDTRRGTAGSLRCVAVSSHSRLRAGGRSLLHERRQPRSPGARLPAFPLFPCPGPFDLEGVLALGAAVPERKKGPFVQQSSGPARSRARACGCSRAVPARQRPRSGCTAARCTRTFLIISSVA